MVSTDGDSDRPLILGVDRNTSKVQFFGGDLVGMLTAELLGADAVVVPISCNDGIDRGSLASITEPKTRIGSPFVIAGMEKSLAAGKKAVCGWEANGGFLTGSDIAKHDKTLRALPTRDAVLPMVAVLSLAQCEGVPLIELFLRLPKRYSRAALIKQFPRATALAMVQRLSPIHESVKSVEFKDNADLIFKDDNSRIIQADSAHIEAMAATRHYLESVFSPAFGFEGITLVNFSDGVRIGFNNGDIAHLRPSGNADELRIYAVADSQARADQIAVSAVAEPEGLLRKLAGMLA